MEEIFPSTKVEGCSEHAVAFKVSDVLQICQKLVSIFTVEQAEFRNAVEIPSKKFQDGGIFLSDRNRGSNKDANGPDRIPHSRCTVRTVIKFRRTIKVERILLRALHPGPFADYKRDPS